MATIVETAPGVYEYQGSPSYLGSGLPGLDPGLQPGWTGFPVVPFAGSVSNGTAGVGPVAPGPQLPGGTAGFPTAAQRTTGGSSWLDGLSHLTGGLTWSHLILWLAILFGGYLVIEHFAGGKRRRR